MTFFRCFQQKTKNKIPGANFCLTFIFLSVNECSEHFFKSLCTFLHFVEKKYFKKLITSFVPFFIQNQIPHLIIKIGQDINHVKAGAEQVM